MSHPQPTALQISTHRFRRSPFAEAYHDERTVYGVYNGRLYPVSGGDDPTASYWTLRRKAVLYDVPEAPLEIRGPDAERLLDEIFVRDITRVRPGRAVYAIACLPDGGMLMDGVLMRLAPDRFWYVQADGEFFTWLLAHSQDLDVTVKDPDSWVLQIQGPRSLDILEAACDGMSGLRYFDVREGSLIGQKVIVSRTGWTGELGFEVYTNDERLDGIALWRHLLDVGKPFGLITASLASMGIRRIEAGILDYGTDMDRSMTPYEAGLGKFVHPQKKRFIGRQALRQADRRTRMFGIRCEGGAPLRGAELCRAGERIGLVTASAWSPYLKCGIGLVRMDAPGEWAEVQADVPACERAEAAAEIVGLPFYDAEKRIARGVGNPP